LDPRRGDSEKSANGKEKADSKSRRGEHKTVLLHWWGVSCFFLSCGRKKGEPDGRPEARRRGSIWKSTGEDRQKPSLCFRAVPAKGKRIYCRNARERGPGGS